MALRLTLRTLLAYLDDTLEPTQARDIGQRIADNEPAQRLIDRIRTVTRRRRITVPQEESGDGSDVSPNDVAEYLDNVLDHERVAEVERVCLESDANLAEVACVHQILSLVLGTPADVSAKMHSRLYALGGFGLSERPSRRRRPAQPIEPVTPRSRVAPSTLETQPLPLAVPAYGVRSGMAGKATTLVAVLGLTAALVAVILQVVSTTPKEDSTPLLTRPSAQVRTPTIGGGDNRDGPGAETAANDPGNANADAADSSKRARTEVTSAAKELSKSVAPAKVTAKTPARDDPGRDAKAKSDAAEKASLTTPSPEKGLRPNGNSRGTTDTATKLALKPDPARTTEPPVDASVPIAAFSANSRVLFRRTADKINPLEPKNRVHPGDRLINLDGFRSVLELPNRSEIELVDQTRVDLRPTAGDRALSFELIEGRIVLRSGDTPANFEINLGGGARLAVRLPAGQAQVGIEASLIAPAEGGAIARRSARLVVARGDIDVSMEGQKVALKGGDEITAPAPFKAEPSATGTDWTRKGQEPIEARSARLTDLVTAESGVTAGLREGLADRNKETRRLAVRAMGALEDYDGLLAALALESDRERDMRHAAIQATRRMLHLDGSKLDDVRARLHVQYNEGNDADNILELLLGFSEAAKRDMETYSTLVALLDSNLLPLRELAIYNLKDLTGNDFNYGADQPATRRKSAVNRWAGWLRQQNQSTLPARKSR